MALRRERSLAASTVIVAAESLLLALLLGEAFELTDRDDEGYMLRIRGTVSVSTETIDAVWRELWTRLLAWSHRREGRMFRRILAQTGSSPGVCPTRTMSPSKTGSFVEVECSAYKGVKRKIQVRTQEGSGILTNNAGSYVLPYVAVIFALARHDAEKVGLRQ
ncbi:hypothetical protein BU15DRAFT_67791 [Melanogaster broomeanus]|nr:hypothetical protein BU15DRAFT_67791 [Melanogaster broomeanus]